MSEVTLWHADCLEAMKRIPDGSVSAIVTDPPYGMTDACEWDVVPPLDRWWAEVRRILIPGGAVVATAAQPFATDLINSNRAWFSYECIWDKHRVTGFFDANRRPLRRHENIPVFAEGRDPVVYNPQFTPGKAYSRNRAGNTAPAVYRTGSDRGRTDSDGQRYPTSIIDCGAQEFGSHPTQKPVPLMEWLILTYTNPGDTIVDCFMGSGTTGVACLRTGRRFIGIELDEGYYNIAVDRIAKAQAAEAERLPLSEAAG